MRRKLSLRAEGVWGSDGTDERRRRWTLRWKPPTAQQLLPIYFKGDNQCDGGRRRFLCESTGHVADNDRKKERGVGERQRQRYKGQWQKRKGREGKEGVYGGKPERQCEVTPLPLALRCLPRTGAAARSDCTPLKQRALVIRALCRCFGRTSQGKCWRRKLILSAILFSTDHESFPHQTSTSRISILQPYACTPASV